MILISEKEKLYYIYSYKSIQCLKNRSCLIVDYQKTVPLSFPQNNTHNLAIIYKLILLKLYSRCCKY